MVRWPDRNQGARKEESERIESGLVAQRCCSKMEAVALVRYDRTPYPCALPGLC